MIDMHEIRRIGVKKLKPQQKPEFVPSPERIARMTAQFRAAKQRKLDQQYPPIDDDCDADLEAAADRESIEEPSDDA